MGPFLPGKQMEQRGNAVSAKRERRCGQNRRVVGEAGTFRVHGALCPRALYRASNPLGEPLFQFAPSVERSTTAIETVGALKDRAQVSRKSSNGDGAGRPERRNAHVARQPESDNFPSDAPTTPRRQSVQGGRGDKSSRVARSPSSIVDGDRPARRRFFAIAVIIVVVTTY